MSATSEVYVASMNLRGEWAPRPPGSFVLNVTSAQRKDSPERRDFSPMSEVPGGYKGYFCFENYWQAGKVFEDIDSEKCKAWWRSLKEGKRRYPKSKGHRVLFARFQNEETGETETYDYISSRKNIYVKEYRRLIQGRESLKKWKDVAASGKVVVVYDFDGPRKEDGTPMCLKVTEEMLLEKINDPRHPFGHGFIVAAEIARIDVTSFL